MPIDWSKAKFISPLESDPGSDEENAATPTETQSLAPVETGGALPASLDWSKAKRIGDADPSWGDYGRK